MSEKRSWEAAREILHKVRAEDGAGSMFILANAIDDAEERGRRSAETEAANLLQQARDWLEFMAAHPGDGEAKNLIARIDAALAPRDSGPVCDAVLSSDPFREWRCGKPKDHEGPHSGEAARDSGKEG